MMNFRTIRGNFQESTGGPYVLVNRAIMTGNLQRNLEYDKSALPDRELVGKYGTNIRIVRQMKL